MPQALPALLKFGGLVIGIGATSSKVLAFAALATRFIATTAAANYLSRRAIKRRRGGAQIQAQESIIRASALPRMVVYGETITGGLVVYANTRQSSVNTNTFDLHMAIAHAAHECEAITDLIYDDDYLTDGIEINWLTNQIDRTQSSPETALGQKYDPTDAFVSTNMYRFLGTDTQAAADVLVDNYAEWTTAHRLKGIAYTVHVFRLGLESQDLWKSGPPQNIRAKVKGKNDVYDPRLESPAGNDPTNAANQAWTDNPVLIVADYMRAYMGIADDKFDWADIAAQATVCDTLVVVPPANSPENTEKLFTCNGVLSLGDSHRSNLEALLTSCMGYIVKSDGKWQIKAGSYTAPTVTITDDDIVGDAQWTATAPTREQFNTARAIYHSKDDRYQEVESIQVQDSTFLNVRDNGDELVKAFRLPFTDSETEAQRLCFKLLDQGNQQGTLQVPLSWHGLNLAPGVGCQVTYAPYSFSSKIFRCINWQLGGSAPIVATLREDASTAWDNPAVGDYSTRTAAGTITPANPMVFNPLGPNFMPFGYTDMQTLVDFTNPVSDRWHGDISVVQFAADHVLAFDTTIFRFAEKSLKVTVNSADGAFNIDFRRLPIAAGSLEQKFNIGHLPDRKWLVVAWFYPQDTYARDNVTLNWGIQSQNGTIRSANFDLTDGAVAGWHQVSAVVDTRSVSPLHGESRVLLQLRVDSLTNESPGQEHSFNVDGVMLFDITDHPDASGDY